ncbi:conserved hypothetical protein [Vibrio chagasii]|nr:conserved hypothetical protein [Vibrio chagasii]CAH7221459.1 conserved hypothetical protein [Vibrio chagasii]
MAIFKDSQFVGQKVHLDGNSFEGCKMTKCILIYAASGPIDMNNCELNDCQWEFSGAAADTLGFLSAMYHEFGEAGQETVEATFEQIKSKPTNIKT